MTLDVLQILNQAGDPVHLNREKAITALENAFENDNLSDSIDAMQALQEGILSMADSDQWEERLGSLRVAKVLVTKRAAQPAFSDILVQTCLDRLEDIEVRVRLAVGDLLRALSINMGTVVWERSSVRILSSIRENFVSNMRLLFFLAQTACFG